MKIQQSGLLRARLFLLREAQTHVIYNTNATIRIITASFVFIERCSHICNLQHKRINWDLWSPFCCYLEVLKPMSFTAHTQQSVFLQNLSAFM